MLIQRLLPAAAATVLATTLAAQQPCSDNLWPIHLVDAQGNELAVEFDATINEDTFVVPTEQVYLAFDPNLASGTYYVHVTDTPVGDGNDSVISGNDPLDRMVSIENVNGAISISLPFSENPQDLQVGVGLGGVGQSLCIGALNENTISGCHFKIWYGDKWDLTYGHDNPYLIDGGVRDDGSCVVRSYHSFRIGDGNGGDISGELFLDANRNGSRDQGEATAAGQQVRLVSTDETRTATTDASGRYTFANAGAGEFTVELVVPEDYVATTPSSHAVASCNCASVTAPDFGIDVEVVACNAKPLRYWRRWNGVCEAVNAGALPTLPALCIVNTCGRYVCPSSKGSLKCYLRRANFWNMGYALSVQLVAMHHNLLTGRVSPDCVINDPCLGVMSVTELMQAAVASLCEHPYTPWCGGNWQVRRQQNKLRRALKRANRNRIWQ